MTNSSGKRQYELYGYDRKGQEQLAKLEEQLTDDELNEAWELILEAYETANRVIFRREIGKLKDNRKIINDRLFDEFDHFMTHARKQAIWSVRPDLAPNPDNVFRKDREASFPTWCGRYGYKVARSVTRNKNRVSTSSEDSKPLRRISLYASTTSDEGSPISRLDRLDSTSSGIAQENETRDQFDAYEGPLAAKQLADAIESDLPIKRLNELLVLSSPDAKPHVKSQLIQRILKNRDLDTTEQAPPFSGCVYTRRESILRLSQTDLNSKK